VPIADASANVAHGAMLTLGLSTGDFSLIGRGLQDRLHQPYRAHLYPRSMALLERASELGAIGATISGAGPTVLFWTQADATGAVVGRLRPLVAGWAEVLRAPFEAQGADVREL
jgi:homoserine kinase